MRVCKSYLLACSIKNSNILAFTETWGVSQHNLFGKEALEMMLIVQDDIWS